MRERGGGFRTAAYGSGSGRRGTVTIAWADVSSSVSASTESAMASSETSRSTPAEVGGDGGRRYVPVVRVGLLLRAAVAGRGRRGR